MVDDSSEMDVSESERATAVVRTTEVLKEQTHTLASLWGKAAVAETRKLPMDIASETSASAGPATARVLRLSDVGGAASARAQAERRTYKDDAALRRSRWSPRATLAVSGGVGLLLWGLVALAVSAIR
jgi:hypothetical protein